MAWRFTPSKYKNTAPVTPKKEETIYDLPIGNLSCTNNAIHANDKLLAFVIDGEGGKIGILPVDARGRRLRGDLNILCAHSDSIADFCFMRFNNLLATCAGAEKLKIWSCEGFNTSADAIMTSDCRSSIQIGDNSNVRTILDCLAPHKTARNVLSVGLGVNAPVVVDLEKEQITIALESDRIDRSLAMDWSDGSLLGVSTDKGKSALLFDPRASKSAIHCLNLHSGIGRENRLVFSDGNLISSGFTTNRAQEVLLYDCRDWTTPIQSEVFEGSTGLLIPLYDNDSRLLFLVGKGSSKFFLTEMKSSDRPSINRLGEHIVKEQTLGACLLPKTACDVMSGEVQRLHQLTKSGIVPIPCIVPRRSYQQFHSDLFPDTVGSVAGSEAEEWLSGSNELPPKVRLGPIGDADKPKAEPSITRKPSDVATSENGNMNGCKASVHYQDVFVRNDDGKVTEEQKEHKPDPILNGSANKADENQHDCNGSAAERQTVESESSSDKENSKKMTECEQKLKKPESTNSPLVRLRSVGFSQDPSLRATIVGAGDSAPGPGIRRARPKSCVVGTVQSKFRHVEVIAGANKSVFTNLRNVNNRLPTESDGFCISQKYAALPLSGTAGIISIFELIVPMKVPDGVIDGLQNRSQVMDLQWNPFRADELAVALDNGNVNIWQIDDNVACIGSSAFTDIIQKAKEEERPVENRRLLSDIQPFRVLNTGQQVRVTHVRYHPTVRDLLAIGLINGCIQLWNVADGVCVHEMKSHSLGILSLAWSADGRRLASVGRDAFLKVYEPLLGTDCCIAEAKVLDSTRAARVLFVCEDSLILVVGFSKSSARQCALFRVDNDAESGNLRNIHTETIDVSTQPLVPYYDYDTSVVFLTGKGDRTIQMFEVCPEAPCFLRLTPTTFSTGHQSIALYQKNACDVRDVEFACGWRLTEKIIEKLSFKVPRVKKELFQRDVFPHALVSWEPTSSAAEWQDGVLNRPKFVDLRPEGMQENEPLRTN